MAERNNINSVTQTRTNAGTSAAGTAMERSADEIRQNIAATRDSISETVDELSSKVQRTFDWKAYVRDYPLAATGIVAGLGLMAGYAIRRRSTPSERISGAMAELAEDVIDRFQYQFNDLGIRRPSLGSTLKAAALSGLAKVAGDYAREKFMASNNLRSQEMADSDYASNAEFGHARPY